MGLTGKVEKVDAFQGAVRQGVDKRFRCADRATLSLAGKDHQGSTRCITRDCSLAGEKSVTEPEGRSEEHTSELQSLMRISYAVFCLKKKKTTHRHNNKQTQQ